MADIGKNKNIPTVLVLFGATGDLTRKKIIPALFHLFQKNQLPALFHVIGFARRSLSGDEFRGLIKEILAEHEGAKGREPGNIEGFCDLFSYRQGLFENITDYQKLNSYLGEMDNKWSVCANKLFYLAVPPSLYGPIFENLAGAGLTKPCSPEEGWTRILVEKPFGKDLKTALALEDKLAQLFKEEQVYRIDHYLAKEMLQNILAFRFANNIFEQSWNRDFIDKIEIRLWESLGVEDRGNFYDGLGALRDVGQNHLLQMLALVTMENPVNFSVEAIRGEREAILQTLVRPEEEQIKHLSFRAQYEGYRNIEGVAKDSQTETYFKTRGELSAPKWRNVPIFIESGKRMPEQRKEIVVTFKHPVPCLCPPGRNHYENRVVISLEPQEQITVQFWSKKPGLTFEVEKRSLEFVLRDRQKRAQYTEEYEKLLLDAILGDQTLFVSSREVKYMWRFIDPVVQAWQENLVPLNSYKPETSEIVAAYGKAADRGYSYKGLKKEIGIVGLGKMGGSIARRLAEKGWRVAGYNKGVQAVKDLESIGLTGAKNLKELTGQLSAPRVIWLMVPAQAVDEVLFGKKGLVSYLQKGDVLVDGGNSYYKDSKDRFEKLKQKGVHFVDAGVSGGPKGARFGASLMIGGEKAVFDKLEPLFYDLSQKNGYRFFEGAGAGHFVKMVHNGIEYGMMQAIAEGFAILKKAEYKLKLEQVAEVYSHGSVIESRLIAWLKDAFSLHGEELADVSGSVGHTGEGEWTAKTAEEQGLKAWVIEQALRFRIESEKKPSYTGKILSALREQFGGHAVKK